MLKGPLPMPMEQGALLMTMTKSHLPIGQQQYQKLGTECRE
jgi:hypothetical protein